MADLCVLGLGNMGLPMARNLVRAGFAVTGWDVAEPARAQAAEAGLRIPEAAEAAIARAPVVLTMLPAGQHVRQIHESLVRPLARPGSLFIDCSTIDVATAREVAAEAEAAGHRMIDAPVSGGTAGAAAGTLTFMIGGDEAAIEAARPFLSAMGRNLLPCGGPGAGQAAKICNNMMLGIQMASVCEGMVLAEHLGLDPLKLFAVASVSSGQCWSLTSYCPIPGAVPTAPSNRGFTPGFAAEMMLKDLHLAEQAAIATGAATPLGIAAAALYRRFTAEGGGGGRDFSALIEFLRELRSKA